MKKIVTLMSVALIACVLFNGCGYYADKSEQEQKITKSVLTNKKTEKNTTENAATVKHEEKKNALENEKIVELISVGNDQVAICQGDSEDSTQIVLFQDEKEIVLTHFTENAASYHIEPFENILCHDGFRLYEQTGLPYGAEVYYIGLEGEKAKILTQNHAIYDEDNKKYSADFDYVMDIDGDGDQEMISNRYYTGDGGAYAFLYDHQKDAVYMGNLTDLFDLEEDEFYYGRVTDIKSQYNPKNEKVTIEYRGKEKPHKIKEKKYKIDLDKISMEKYIDKELKDIRNYDY